MRGCGRVWGQARGDGTVTASLEANCMSVRWTAGRQEAAAGLQAWLDVSWATKGSSGVAGCSRVWGQAGSDGTVTASLEVNRKSTRWAAGR